MNLIGSVHRDQSPSGSRLPGVGDSSAGCATGPVSRIGAASRCSASIIDAIDVFGGDLTCCRLGHPNAEPCDREALMLPMLGLFCELYRDRHRHRRSRAAYNTIEPHLERLYPRRVAA